jgi:hypothetical protein
MAINNVSLDSSCDDPFKWDPTTDPFAEAADPFKFNPTNNPSVLFQNTLFKQPSSLHSTERISNVARKHLQEGAPPSQTQESSPRRSPSSEGERLVTRKRSRRTANASDSLPFGESYFHLQPTKDLSQLPEEVPSGPIQVRGHRGGSLVKAIRTHYGWTPEDLQRQLVSYAVGTINGWESGDKIFWPAAKALGSLFRLDADLFYCNAKEKKTCQSWTPPLFQKQENPSVESVQQSGNLDELIGLRGAPLLKAIRKYYGWTLEDLRRHIEEAQQVSYSVRTLNLWEIPGNLSWKGANVLGSLFGLEADLFYGDSEKTCQASWTPPSFEQPSSVPSSGRAEKDY